MKLEVLEDTSLEELKKVVAHEEEAFAGKGNVDTWILKALIRYGKVFVFRKEGEIICIAEYMQVMGENTLFLYGISTKVEERHRGWAKKMMLESEQFLKNIGYHKISLTVDPENDIAVKMYKNLGYTVEEIQKNEYGEGIDRLLMKKVII